eukprot:Clim_evm12s246 gene=Clim_evmTU12s246
MPPPPPPPPAPVKVTSQATGNGSTTMKHPIDLTSLIKSKTMEIEAEPDLTEEQLAFKDSGLTKVTCQKCGKTVLEDSLDDHETSHAAEILPGLYLGGQRNAWNKKELKRNQIKHILNVAEEVSNIFEDCPIDCECTNGVADCQGKTEKDTNDLSAATDSAMEEERLFRYTHYPMVDKKHQDITASTLEILNQLDEALRKGDDPEPVLVHCVAGISRSASVVIAYVMVRHKCSLKDAYQHVKDRRSIVSPNPSFIEQLQKIEQHLHDRGMLDIDSDGIPSLAVQDVYPPGTMYISSG